MGEVLNKTGASDGAVAWLCYTWIVCLSCRHVGLARYIMDDADFPDGYPVCEACGSQLVEPIPSTTAAGRNELLDRKEARRG